MSEDQNKLVRLAKQGDQEAITELYQQTRNMAFFAAMRYVKNEPDAADVLQNAYIAAFSKLDTFDEKRSFEPWLRKIVVNQALNFLRGQKVVFADEELIEQIEDDEGLIPAHYLEQQEKREKILEIVHALPDGQRLAITLHYFEGMPVAEIAEVMGVKPATAKSHLFFGRKAIKEAVLEEERKGNKLYVLLPIPALTQIFELEAQAAQMPAALSEAVLGSIAQSLPAAGGAAAPGATAATAAPAAPAAPAGLLAKVAAVSVPVKAAVIVAAVGVITTTALVVGGAFAEPDAPEQAAEVPEVVAAGTLADGADAEADAGEVSSASAIADEQPEQPLADENPSAESQEEFPQGEAAQPDSQLEQQAPEEPQEASAQEETAPQQEEPAPEPAAQPAAQAGGRMQSVYDPNVGFYEIPFEERFGPGWEPAVQGSDGTWSQRFVYNGIAEYASPLYSGLASPPYPYPGNQGSTTTVTWVPEWGAWHVAHEDADYLETIVHATGGAAYVRRENGQVAENYRPLGS